jgi:hypothetical protein
VVAIKKHLQQLRIGPLIGVLLISCTRPLTVDNAEPTLPVESILPLIDNSEIADLSLDQETLICATIAEYFKVPDSLRTVWPPSLVFIAVLKKNPSEHLLACLSPSIHIFKPATSGRLRRRSEVLDSETGQRGKYFQITSIEMNSDSAVVEVRVYVGPLAASGWKYHFNLEGGEWILAEKEMTMLS